MIVQQFHLEVCQALVRSGLKMLQMADEYYKQPNLVRAINQATKADAVLERRKQRRFREAKPKRV